MVRPPIIKVVRDLELEENLDLSCEARKHLDDLFGDRMNLSALIDNPIPNWFDSSSYFVIPSDNFKQGIRIYNQGFNLEALREKRKKFFVGDLTCQFGDLYLDGSFRRVKLSEGLKYSEIKRILN